eukprot:gene7315-9724_t
MEMDNGNDNSNGGSIGYTDQVNSEIRCLVFVQSQLFHSRVFCAIQHDLQAEKDDVKVVSPNIVQGHFSYSEIIYYFAKTWMKGNCHQKSFTSRRDILATLELVVSRNPTIIPTDIRSHEDLHNYLLNTLIGYETQIQEKIAETLINRKDELCCRCNRNTNCKFDNWLKQAKNWTADQKKLSEAQIQLLLFYHKKKVKMDCFDLLDVALAGVEHQFQVQSFPKLACRTILLESTAGCEYYLQRMLLLAVFHPNLIQQFGFCSCDENDSFFIKSVCPFQYLLESDFVEEVQSERDKQQTVSLIFGESLCQQISSCKECNHRQNATCCGIIQTHQSCSSEVISLSNKNHGINQIDNVIQLDDGSETDEPECDPELLELLSGNFVSQVQKTNDKGTCQNLQSQEPIQLKTPMQQLPVKDVLLSFENLVVELPKNFDKDIHRFFTQNETSAMHFSLEEAFESPFEMFALDIILSYLRLLVNNKHDLAFLRVLSILNPKAETHEYIQLLQHLEKKQELSYFAACKSVVDEKKFGYSSTASELSVWQQTFNSAVKIIDDCFTKLMDYLPSKLHTKEYVPPVAAMQGSLKYLQKMLTLKSPLDTESVATVINMLKHMTVYCEQQCDTNSLYAKNGLRWQQPIICYTNIITSKLGDIISKFSFETWFENAEEYASPSIFFILPSFHGRCIPDSDNSQYNEKKVKPTPQSKHVTCTRTCIKRRPFKQLQPQQPSIQSCNRLGSDRPKFYGVVPSNENTVMNTTAVPIKVKSSRPRQLTKKTVINCGPSYDEKLSPILRVCQHAKQQTSTELCKTSTSTTCGRKQVIRCSKPVRKRKQRLLMTEKSVTRITDFYRIITT